MISLLLSLFGGRSPSFICIHAEEVQVIVEKATSTWKFYWHEENYLFPNCKITGWTGSGQEPQQLYPLSGSTGCYHLQVRLLEDTKTLSFWTSQQKNSHWFRENWFSVRVIKKNKKFQALFSSFWRRERSSLMESYMSAKAWKTWLMKLISSKGKQVQLLLVYNPPDIISVFLSASETQLEKKKKKKKTF